LKQGRRRLQKRLFVRRLVIILGGCGWFAGAVQGGKQGRLIHRPEQDMGCAERICLGRQQPHLPIDHENLSRRAVEGRRNLLEGSDVVGVAKIDRGYQCVAFVRPTVLLIEQCGSDAMLRPK
jgi:hypothetical protein